MKRFFKCGIAFSLALLSLMLVACGCSKNMEPYATVTRTPDNTGGANLSFSYNTDTHTAWFGGEGETIDYYAENVGIGRSAGNRVGITITAPEEITTFDGFKLTIYEDKVYEGLNDNGKPTAFDGENYCEINIAKQRELFVFIYKIQEEVHRYSIGRMTQAKRKTVKTSSLTKIDGIGPSKAKALLAAFGGYNGVKNASVDALKSVKGINSTDVLRIRAYFDKKTEE